MEKEQSLKHLGMRGEPGYIIWHLMDRGFITILKVNDVK